MGRGHPKADPDTSDHSPSPVWRAITLIVTALLGVKTMVVLIRAPRLRMPDLEVYRAAGRALLSGSDIYSAHIGDNPLHFVYPPFAALFFSPLVIFPKPVSQVILTVLSLAALWVCVSLCVRVESPRLSSAQRYFPQVAFCLLALFLEPVSWTIDYGQVNLLLLCLVLVDVLVPWRGRGVLVGLAAAIKLTPAVFILYFLITRRVKEGLIAGAVFLGSVLVGFVLGPAHAMTYWTHDIRHPEETMGVPFVGNQSFTAVAARLGADVSHLGALWTLSMVALLAVGLVLSAIIFRRGDELLAVTVCATAGLLVSPISWAHHWVWAVPISIILWTRGLALVSPAAGRRAEGVLLLVAATAWTVLFWLAPMWWVSDYQGRTLVSIRDLLVSSGYVIAGCAYLIFTSIAFFRFGSASSGADQARIDSSLAGWARRSRS